MTEYDHAFPLMIRTKYCILIIFSSFHFTSVYSQDFFEKWGNRLFFHTLKHEVWQPYFELDTLKKNDSVYIWSRYVGHRDRKTNKGKYAGKDYGDIRFKRNGIIYRRTFVKPAKKDNNGTNKFTLEWVEYGKWRRDQGFLIIEIDDFYSKLEWFEQARDIINLRVVEAYKKSAP